MKKTQLSFERTADRMRDVWGTFLGVVEAFNENDWNAYEQYLDENVVVYNLGVVGYTIGKVNVTNYFRGISTQNNLDLQFWPFNEINLFPGTFPYSVRGRAYWTHKASHHVEVPIRYECQFAAGRSSLLTAVWAEHLVGD